MQSSLHLSDLSSSSFSLSKPTSKQKQSLYNSNDSPKSQLLDVQEKRNKIQQYSANLTKFENKLNIDKRKSAISKKRSLDQINDEMNTLATKFIDLQQKEREIKEKKEEKEKLLSEQKFILLQFEDELRQISRKNDWAETTFSKDILNQEDEKPSIQILILQSKIEKLDSTIKNMKQKIFHYQKEMVKISEAMSPTRFQQHQLLSKIDDFNSSFSSSNSSVLDEEEKRSFINSIEEKRILYTKTCIENQIKRIQNKIKKIDKEKDTITEKILEVKSVLNDSIVESIQEQVKQFKEALKRKERLYEEKLNAAHSAISRELDIKIEKDHVHSYLVDVQKQLDDIKIIIEKRNNEISRLEKISATDEDFLAVDQSGRILKSLIRNIQEQRSLNIQLEEDLQYISTNQIENINDEIDQREIQQVKININENEILLKNEIDEINQEILSLKDHLDECINMKEQQQNQSNLQEQDQSNILEQNQLDYQTDENNSSKDDSFSIKNQFNNDKINEIERDIAKLTKKKDKKLDKIRNIQNQIDDLISQLDLSKTYPIFAVDFFEKFERSIGWLNKAVKKELKIWRGLQIFSLQTIDEWDTKVLLASSNEAEDLCIRFLSLNLSDFIFPSHKI